MHWRRAQATGYDCCNDHLSSAIIRTAWFLRSLSPDMTCFCTLQPDSIGGVRGNLEGLPKTTDPEAVQIAKIEPRILFSSDSFLFLLNYWFIDPGEGIHSSIYHRIYRMSSNRSVAYLGSNNSSYLIYIYKKTSNNVITITMEAYYS